MIYNLSYCVASVVAHKGTTAADLKEYQDKIDNWIKDNL